MDNQHRLIPGYSDLGPTELFMMKKIKDKEQELVELYREVHAMAVADDDEPAMRHVQLAKTALEGGFMWLLKAIARPTNGLGQER
jgi:hypothetical protein